MSKKLAIKGHVSRGKEIITLLEMMGGYADELVGNGTDERYAYFILEEENNAIDGFPIDKKDEFEFDSQIFTLIFTLEEFLEKYPFKVGDIVDRSIDYVSCVIDNMRWNSEKCCVEYHLNYLNGSEYGWHVSDDLIKPENEDVITETKVESTGFMQVCKTAGIIFNDANYADEVELYLGDYEIEVRDSRTYAVLKKSKYPKTIEECVKLLRVDFKLDMDSYKRKLMANFYRLILCRDTYWKIAGEEMGLGKPWNPKYGCGKWGYWIGYDISANKTYCQDSRLLLNLVLVFPTTEMRDAFYENFKDLIEQCKELL